MLLRGCLVLALTLACPPTDRPAPASRPAPRQAISLPPPEQPTTAPETETPPESLQRRITVRHCSTRPTSPCSSKSSLCTKPVPLSSGVDLAAKPTHSPDIGRRT